MSDSNGNADAGSSMYSSRATSSTKLKSGTSHCVSVFEDDSIPEATKKLIHQLLQEDHDAYLKRSKGKERADRPSDSRISVDIWGSELQLARQSLEDSRMALSISNAVASDQYVLAKVQEQDTMASRDRTLALRLSGRSETQEPLVPKPKMVAKFGARETNAVIEVISSLGEQTASSNDEAASIKPAATSNQNRSGSKACTACMQPMVNDSKYLPACGHSYCDECLKMLYLMATGDELSYPPRCCGNVFPPSIALRLLSYKELQAFCNAGVEFTSKQRVYCADAKCSTFIPPWMIKLERAKCPRCSKITHTTCKALGEPSHDCPSDEGLKQVLALAETQGWKRCSRCKAIVEIKHGCNHMTCRCGKEFCYVCGATWKTCKCARWHEERLLDLAHRAAENRVDPQAPEHVRQRAVQRAVRQLRQHTDCDHTQRELWEGTRRGNLRCEVCNDELDVFILECTQCLMRACRRCVHNRMRGTGATQTDR